MDGFCPCLAPLCWMSVSPVSVSVKRPPLSPNRCFFLGVIYCDGAGTLMSSVISTTDNDNWKLQRNELNEAFLPVSSISRTLPISQSRSNECVSKLQQLAEVSVFGFGVVVCAFGRRIKLLAASLFCCTNDTTPMQANASLFADFASLMINSRCSPCRRTQTVKWK